MGLCAAQPVSIAAIASSRRCVVFVSLVLAFDVLDDLVGHIVAAYGGRVR